MKFQHQLIRHDPDNGHWGDCARAAIAGLLQRPLVEVPHFNLHNMAGRSQSDAFRAWLKPYNLTLFETAFEPDLEGLFQLMDSLNPGLLYILSGTSPRGRNHAVLARGDNFVFDPHPDGGFLVGPSDDGYFHIQIIAHQPGGDIGLAPPHVTDPETAGGDWSRHSTFRDPGKAADVERSAKDQP